MVVSKLVYDGQPVGLRFSEIPFKKGISADMSYEVGKKIIDEIKDILFGNDVPVKLKNGMYISDEEQGAVEILSYDEWLGFVHCNQTVVANVYERSGVVRNSKGTSSCSIELYELEEKYPHIRQLGDRLRAISNLAICDIDCHSQVFERETYAFTDIVFPDLLEFNKFIHEWYKYENYISIVSESVNFYDNINDSSVNTVKCIYNKLKSITHSAYGYVYPGVNWKKKDWSVDRPKVTIGEFSFYPSRHVYGVCVELNTKVLSWGYES